MKNVGLAHATRLSLWAIMSVASAAAGAAEPVSVQWTPDGRFEHQATIAPKQFLEVCDTIASGARVAWEFSSDAALDFNVHFHEGTAVRYPVKIDAVRSEAGVFKPKKTADYCWMWTNRGAQSASITLTLEQRR